jgi:leucyl-tRNA---protein transferase
MRLDRFDIINEEFRAAAITLSQLDALLADGWRHFGQHFFRYNFGIYEDRIERVIPLRIRLGGLALSKSQRRTLRRNAGLDVSFSPPSINPELHELFARHKLRFRSGIPDNIYDFIPRGDSPTHLYQINVLDAGRLVAASFFDVGETSVSSIYGIFDPDESTRGLGIFTMLKEIEFARDNGKTLYYHGYAYEGESYYDYKKRFNALEAFDWRGEWHAFSEEPKNLAGTE